MWAIYVGEYLAAALFGVLILERCNMGGTGSVITWLAAYPGLFFLALVICASLYCFIRAFFRKPVWPFAIYGSLVCLMGTANFFKLFYRTEPLVPYDLFNVGPAFAIAGNMSMRLTRGLVFNLVFFVLCLLGLWVLFILVYPPAPPRRWWRFALMLLLPALCLYSLTDVHRLALFGAEDIRYDQYYNYQINGFIVSTLMNLGDSRVQSPRVYNYDEVAALREAIEEARNPLPLGSPKGQPHIIVLQMEAYADPRRIDPRVAYALDPFSPLAPYESKIQRFHTLVSTIGGGTSNTEYEFLTGFNLFYCPMGVTPFIQYMNQPRPSLASALTEQGYTSVAVHPHIGRFYNRDAVFPKLGFQRFVTEEEFVGAEHIGLYISDDTFGGKIVEIFEEERANGPVFIYGISIQNHGPYFDPDVRREYPVELNGGLTLTDAQITELETFGANLYDSSVMLANMIQYLSTVDEPILLLVYGDHQAAWLWAMDGPGTPDVELNRYSTESFYWANYPLANEHRPVVGASVLGTQLMRKAGLPLPLYNKGIDLQSRELMAYNVAITVENDGSLRYATRERLEAYLLLQYDRMFGKNYLE